MKFNLLTQTENKFKGTCYKCSEENVILNIGYAVHNSYRGEAESYTRVSLTCPDCKNEWSELF